MSLFATALADSYRGEDVLTATFRFASGFQSHLWFCSTPSAVQRADRLLVAERGTCSSEAWHAWQGGAACISGDPEIAWADQVRTWLAELDPVTLEHVLPVGSWDETTLHSSPEIPLTYGIGTALFDFARAVRTKSLPEIGPEEGRAAVAICVAMSYGFRLMDSAEGDSGRVGPEVRSWPCRRAWPWRGSPII